MHKCSCPTSVELICEATPEMDVGTTIWRHGEGEAAMVVTPEMREEWAARGESATDQMDAWIERVHVYQARGGGR